jgi:CubicO group peptidase (beta-lactamase class C family)
MTARNPRVARFFLAAIAVLRSSAVLVAVAAACGLTSTGCVYARIVYFAFPTLAAPNDFDNRLVHASRQPLPLTPDGTGTVLRLSSAERERYRSFDDFLERNDTRAFLVIRDDRIVYERYFGGVRANTLLPGFSESKTVAALLVGCALSDGLIASVDHPVAEYVPELRGRSGYDRMTIDDLLRMTPGIDFTEASVDGAVLYYTTDLPSLLYSYPAKWPPGTHYLYGSLSTEILWDVLRRRLAERGVPDVSRYFEERVWEPVGAEGPATWSLDSASSGAEKLFAGFNATARDHARIGLVYLHGGVLGGRRIVPQAWVDASVAPDPVAGKVHTSDGWVKRGRYEWFLTLDGRAFFAKGFEGQYIFVVPERRMVFVRFGEGYGDVDWPALFLRLADSMAGEPAEDRVPDSRHDPRDRPLAHPTRPAPEGSERQHDEADGRVPPRLAHGETEDEHHVHGDEPREGEQEAHGDDLVPHRGPSSGAARRGP